MMWLLFLLQSSNPNPDDTGAYDLGTVNDAPNKNWTKITPYSPAQVKLKWRKHEAESETT
jgi:hypothetical protein